jgi:hypothetical protein
LRFLEQELQPYKSILSKAADAVIDQEVSDYPIFVVHQQEVSMGIPLVDKDKTKGNWSVNVSSLEEFVTKQIINNEKVENFRKTYKDPEEFLCLFVLSELGATFIFIPRK